MNQTMPAKDELQAAVGRVFLISNALGASVEATLAAVYDGVPMNKRYCCFSAEFALPVGQAIASSVYGVSDGQSTWPLLLTPVGRDEEDRPLVEAVFHYPVSQPAAVPTAG
ncbi:hypothetical protein [Chitinimonas koreensis]|uniref:hypothetical protein n=1 Tax=Chitinimonas koreensis TaxID=356302 RepID=UPI0003F6E2E0|nr:hypothetical protein [Chitinimonas koreensis]QNM97035.1 hypothetical protein H9L41_01460 [Chitinimonas koreensis]